MSTHRSLHTIIGIGASSGGLEGIQEFFNLMPPSDQLTFIVMQHLSPNYRSMMRDLLAHHTTMPITVAEHNMALEPGVIYLIPPAFEATIHNDCFQLSKINRKKLPSPINTLFTSLATFYQDRAIGIILSGTGNDGAQGITAIAKYQGLTLVETPTEAKFSGMPTEAIATEQVNYVLSIAEMPEIILEYISQPGDFNRNLKQMKLINESEYAEVLHLLDRSYNSNFSLYKIGTISRRIQRRMSLAGMSDLPTYAAYLAQNRAAQDNLYHDLLIGVTEFFRDPSAFAALQAEVLPELFAQFKHTQTSIRIWITACATGEEAYTVAILLKKYADDHHLPFLVKIIATDLSPQFINKAKKGCYSYQDVAKIPVDLLNSYFIKNSDHYEIIPEIKHQILFVTHNLLVEPPFTKLDLICCRNLLIYIKPHEQNRILDLLKFSLNVGGFLFLGPSEGSSELKHDLTTISQTWKIFKKNQRSNPIQIAPTTFNKPLTKELSPAVMQPNTTDSLPLFAYNAILNEVVFAGFVIDATYVILHSIGKAREMITLPEGAPTLILPKIIIDELKGGLITALHKAKMSLQPVVYRNISIANHHGKTRRVKMSVHPICDKGQNVVYYWIRLDTVKIQNKQQKKIIISDTEKYKLHDEIVITLEKELSEARIMLQSSMENIETVNEEMQSTNEELMASNEELQSTNTELQSVNEELNSVNAERAKKIEEVIQTKNDLDNLIRSAEISTIILNAKLEIRIFTPGIKKIFNLLEQDIGRPLENFKHNLKFNLLLDKATDVLSNNVAYEEEIKNQHDYWYLLKIAPYHVAQSHTVTGVVITFVDINQMKLLQQEKENITKELRLALKIGQIGIWHCNLQNQSLVYDETIKKMFGLQNHFPMNEFSHFLALIHPDDKKRVETDFDLTLTKGQDFEQNFRIIRPDSSIRFISCSANVHQTLPTEPNYLVGVCWDITEKYWLEEKIIDAEHLNLSLDTITDGWWDWNMLTNELHLSPLLKKTLGYADHELADRMESYEELMLPDDRRALQHKMQEYIANNHDFPIIQEVRFKHKSGRILWILSHRKGILSKQGKLVRMVGVLTDVTSLREKAASLEKLAYRDFLTQVPNKSAFLDNLARSIARCKRKQLSLAVLYLDIDNFKQCNDQFGHAFGDAVLCAVANKLINTSRTIDFIARLAGDEFSILLEEFTQEQEVLDIAQRYLNAFHEAFVINNQTITISLSIGIALYPQHGETEQALLASADQAMYRAKQQGKNQAVCA